jgi:hypothetical protein
MSEGRAMLDDGERQILERLRDLEADPDFEPEIASTAGQIVARRRDGGEVPLGIATANALDSLLARGWVAETGIGSFRITSAGLRAVGPGQ